MTISDRRRIAGTCLLVLGAVLMTLTQVTPSGAAAQAGGELGDQVWFDDNDNGRVDAEEAGVAGVTVELFADSNLDGAPDGPVLQTAVSGADGRWRFVGLADGPYAVRLPATNWNDGGALRGCVSSAPTTNDARDGVDGDDNGFELAGVGIIGGPVEISASNPVDLSMDFGCHRPVFDVALALVPVAPSELDPGDLLVLQLDVGNVGTLNASDLAVQVSMTDGLVPADPDWEVLKEGGLLRQVAVDLLRPGITASLSLQLEVQGDGPHEVVAALASVASTDVMPNGDGFEPAVPAAEAVATLQIGGPPPIDPVGPPVDEPSEPVDEPAQAVEPDPASEPADPTQPDSAVEGASIESDPVPDTDGAAEETENEVPRQAVAPADVAQADDGVAPVLALTGAEDRLVVLAALMCIVAGSILLLLERWVAPVEG
jgi:hypothetical protein